MDRDEKEPGRRPAWHSNLNVAAVKWRASQAQREDTMPWGSRCLSMILLVLAFAVSADESRPPIDSQTVMFYYRNIDEAARFYGETLGLPTTFDSEWVKIFRIGATSSVGVVTEGEGTYHQTQPENAVMLSIVTAEVDSWYARLKAAGDVKFLKTIYNSESVPIRAFLVQDPGGYTIEFYQWWSDEEDMP
jgi:predicted enzyme related to lactoylglutathione lyase